MWGHEMGVVQREMAGAWTKFFRLEVLSRAFLLFGDLLIPNLLTLNQLFHDSLFKADLSPQVPQVSFQFLSTLWDKTFSCSEKAGVSRHAHAQFSPFTLRFL